MVPFPLVFLTVIKESFCSLKRVSKKRTPLLWFVEGLAEEKVDLIKRFAKFVS